MSIQDDLQLIVRLAAESVEQLAKLIQNEANLAKAELSSKLSYALRGVGYLAAGSLFLTPAIALALLALAQWLMQQGLGAAVSYLLASALAFVLGASFILVGVRHLRPENLAPTVTAREVQRDIAAAEEITR